MTPTAVKITDAELESLRNVQEEYLNLTQELGEFHYQQTLIDKNILNINELLAKTDEKRINLIKQLEVKYGVGSVDLQTGEFIK